MMINPIPYFTAAGGLNLESQIFDTEEAKAMIKNEFKIEYQDGSISEASFENSFESIQIATAQTIAKVTAKTMFVIFAFDQVSLANKYNTQEMKISGTTVSKVFTKIGRAHV